MVSPLLALLLSVAAAPVDSCMPPDTVDVDARSAGSTRRAITSHDLLGLRDIDTPRLSPDGRSVAFRLHQARLDTNDYCIAWVVVDVGSGHARSVHDGGDPIWWQVPQGLRTGNWRDIQPQWSPDGEWIAYLKELDGRIELWRARRDGGAERVAREDGVIDTFTWTPDASALLYEVGPSLVAWQRAVEEESRIGFVLDERFMPYDQDRPHLLRDSVPASEPDVRVYEFATGSSRPATAGERASYLAWTRPTSATDADERHYVRSPDASSIAWGEPVDARLHGIDPPLRLRARSRDGSTIVCEAAACEGHLLEVFWSLNGETVYFTRKEGAARDAIGLYAWTVSDKAVVLVLRTYDRLEGCGGAVGRVVCAHESWTTPRKIVAINPATGALQAVFDPNPEFREIELSPVRRMELHTPEGRVTHAHVVEPLGHEGMEAAPLVITTYVSRGFLRGGVGDEYPVHVLAAKGFRVLSFNHTADREQFARYTGVEFAGYDFRGAKQVRESLSAIEVALDTLTEEGSVDPCRIGISGLSNGANITHYSIINSNRFAAAATSTPSFDPSRMFLSGPYVIPRMRLWGFGFPASDTPVQWDLVSLARNADRLVTPLLWLLPDAEYLLALEAWATLKDVGHPVEARIFPDESHVKMQPRHRLAIYDTSVDWFRFWLMGKESADPDKHEQNARWRTLRQQRTAECVDGEWIKRQG